MMKIKIQFLLLLLTISASLCSQLTISTERPDQIYEAGEEMNFIISSATTVEATYSIQFDKRTPVIETGKITVPAGQEVYIPFTLNEPGTVLFEITDGLSDPIDFGVAFSPFDIGTFEECPADFDDFWTDQINQLSTIPIDPQLTIFQTSAANITYRINLASVDNRRVYGYISIPNGTGPFPAVLTLPPFGPNPDIALPEPVVSELFDAISVSISIHNVEPDVFDPNSYLPNNLEDREEYYYRTSILAGIRIIDYIFSRPDFDGENLVVTGNSQGGGLAIAVSSLDTRVSAMTIANPALCEHAAFKYG